MNRDEILALLVADLRDKLAEIGLNRTGRKVELQNRLLAHYGFQTDQNDEEVRDEGETADEINEELSFRTVASNNEQARGNERRDENPIGSGQRRQADSFNSGRSWFTLKDVEGSVSQFSGTSSPDINQWIEELEECALTVEWNQLQVFIYAKQLLSGAAKLFIRSQRDIRDWNVLKGALIDEFGVKVSSAEIHRRLGKRQKRKNETLHEYLYALMELAKPIYFVSGIPDSSTNKALLYQARNMRQSKVQIEAYQKMTGSVRSQGKFDSHFNKGEKELVKSAEKFKKCFNCGDESHIKRDCPKRDNRCFS
ncbi:uncharacterized protein LOC117191071 [Drosophila miranda]|uniref:uncharacterized protein LOC117191071 n=1 Tax=Drosophila miranda TaxID=7229 RepID=UPI00143F4CA9|nr:uncharacterized protein LOC117191071 [Drosophila miranda]